MISRQVRQPVIEMQLVRYSTIWFIAIYSRTTDQSNNAILKIIAE